MMFVLHHRPPLPAPFIIREPKPPATTQKIVAGYHWSWISKERGLFLTETPDSHPRRPTPASAHPARDGGRRPGASPRHGPVGPKLGDPANRNPGTTPQGSRASVSATTRGNVGRQRLDGGLPRQTRGQGRGCRSTTGRGRVRGFSAAWALLRGRTCLSPSALQALCELRVGSHWPGTCGQGTSSQQGPRGPSHIL